MSEPVELIDVWRRTLDATVQFYRTVGELAVDYLQSLVASVTTLETTPVSRAGASGSANSPVSHPAPLTRPPHPVSTMVLEAEDGAQAVGVFLVENLLSRPVTASPAASDFLGEDGRKIKSSLIFHPPSMTLAPGEQILVRVQASFGKDMKPGVRYQGEIRVPGLLGTSIPLALCKTENSNAPAADVPSEKRRRTRNNGRRSRPKTTKKKLRR
jgi:hypothetical protein